MLPLNKLAVGGLLVTAAIGYLAFLGAGSNWQYYLSVDEAAIDAAHLSGKRIRVSGRVGGGSLVMRDDRRQASFDLHGVAHKLHVSCQCTIPDNFAENIEVVVEGRLEDGSILGHKVITRCASKYEKENAPPPVAESLRDSDFPSIASSNP